MSYPVTAREGAAVGTGLRAAMVEAWSESLATERLAEVIELRRVLERQASLIESGMTQLAHALADAAEELYAATVSDSGASEARIADPRGRGRVTLSERREFAVAVGQDPIENEGAVSLARVRQTRSPGQGSDRRRVGAI